MPKINFNKIYVIESLDDDETKTGELLFKEVISIRTNYIPTITSEFVSIETLGDIQSCLNIIKNECISNQIKPIIHFEIHGSSNGLGLVLKNGQFFSYKELTKLLREINIACENNLFLTLAVCHGAWIMQNATLSNPCPFVGIIGSFEEIPNLDLYLRYTEFYSEFLLTFDFEKSFDILKMANKDIKIPNSYRVLDAIDMFKKSYKNYITENTSDQGIRERLNDIHNGIGGVKKPTFNSKMQKEIFNIAFKEHIKLTKQSFYKKHSELFFMIDKFPNNRIRFNVPISYKDL